DVPDPRYGHSAVWTGTEMIVWGGERMRSSGKGPANAGRYDPVTDTWRGVSPVGAPEQNMTVHAVWSGSEMIVWGGPQWSGRYSPQSDTWSPISTVGMPEHRPGQTVVWTGHEV